jgi:glucosamine-6-phosphate deaminase
VSIRLPSSPVFAYFTSFSFRFPPLETLWVKLSYWGGRDRVPRRALTAGMVQLLGARRTLLLVSGEHKREILRQTVEGPVTPDVPASFLQTAANVTILADAAAWPWQERPNK